MTSNEREVRMAELLREACEVLNEAQARNDRKEIKSNLKSMKADEACKAFMKGKLSQEDADKFYTECQKDIAKLKDDVANIPSETTGEKIASFFRSPFTLSSYTRCFIMGTIIGVVENIAINIALKLNCWKAIIALTIASTGASYGAIIANFSKERTTSEGEKNFNKAYAERLVNRFEKNLNAAYQKHYGTQNEAVIDALFEAAMADFDSMYPIE